MNTEDGRTQSVWAGVPAKLPAADVGPTDVVVIGAGISGLTTAYLLAKEGKTVTLVDEGPAGRGQTERTSAHLASVLDDRFATLEQERGLEVARLAYQSHAAAIDLIETISRDESIDCDFARLDAVLFAGEEPTDVTLADEFAACSRVGVKGLAWTDATSGVNTGRAVRFPDQARFHPTRYTAGLAAACDRLGVRFVTGRRATDARGAQDGQSPTVELDDGKADIECQAIVVATNVPSPVNDWFSLYLKAAAYRTYMVGHVVPDGSVPDLLYWDTHDPYHYTRLTTYRGKTILLTGGEDHKTGQDGATTDRFAALAAWAKTVFPQAGEEVARWSGQVLEPADGLALIGVAPTKGTGVYVITGDSGMGLTHGTLGAQLVTDLIFGRENPYTAVYAPDRFLYRSEAIKEDLNTNLQYLDWVTGGDIRSPDDLQPGDGGLMRSGLKKLAVYKDENGGVTACTAVCPHLQAVLQWNPVEGTWDCPAHGSRFGCRGALLMGPAIDDLARSE